jgi:hypothetical protein
MKEKVKTVLRYILAIGFGFVAGYFVKSELLVPRGNTDKEWQHQFTEDADHGRIIDFQDALQVPKDAKNTDELSKQLDAQLKIEDLIIKSREADYSKWTPFTPLFTGRVGAGLGFLTACWEGRAADHRQI